MNTPGPVETAIRAHFTKVPVQLRTYGRGAIFALAAIDSAGIVLKLGNKHTATRLKWNCLEGVPAFLAGHGGAWIPAGGGWKVTGQPGTLDAYLKACIKRDCAPYIAVVLEAAGVIKTTKGTPLMVYS